MIESNVIHSEVKELLLDVREQANKYNYYFELLEKIKKQAENKIDRIDNLLSNQDIKFNKVLDKYRNDNEKLVKDLETKIQDFSEFELKKKELDQYLVEFEEKLNRDENSEEELKKEIQDYIDSLNKEVKNETNKLKSYVITEIELESRSLESKIYDRIRKIDRHLDQYDKRIYESNSLQEETNKKIFKQLRLVEGIVDSVKDITQSLSRTMNNDLRNTETHILEKIDILEERQEKIKQIEFLDDIVNIDKSISEYKNKYYREVENQNIMLENYKSEINLLNKENQNLKSEIDGLKNKTNTAVVTSVISLLLMLALAAML
jgi:chromosome segregation ATPase